VDPIAAASAAGDVFVGGLEADIGGPQRVIIQRMAASNWLPEGGWIAAMPSCGSRDKPWMTIGPAPKSPGEGAGGAECETVYVSTNHTLPPRGQHITGCLKNLPLGSAWPADEHPVAPCSGCPAVGGRATAMTVVTHPSLRGRLVMAVGDFGGLPAWMFSEDAGLSWSGSLMLPPNDPPTYHGSKPMGHLPSSSSGVRPNFRPTSFPSIDTSPFDRKTVAIAFCGIDATAPDDVDIFIAVSTDGGKSFDSDRLYRLLDSQISTSTDGTGLMQQAMPAIKFDGEGGLNLVFVNARDIDAIGGATRATIRYVRFADAGESSLTGAAQAVQDLSPLFTLGSSLKIGLNHNDYLMIDGAGDWLYAAYARTTDSTPDVGSIFAVRIAACPCAIADANGDGDVTGDDMVAFASAAVRGKPGADADLNGTVTGTRRDALPGSLRGGVDRRLVPPPRSPARRSSCRISRPCSPWVSRSRSASRTMTT
jgi:hypothetical protein